MTNLNINEACKLAKNIEGFKTYLSSLLSNRDYTVKIVETHLKKKSNPEVEDETIDVETNKLVDISVEDILVLIDKLVKEKAAISRAIELAKHNATINVNGLDLTLDSAIEYNKSLRDITYYISNLNKLKEGTVKGSDSDYKMDIEGKQTRYIYTKEVTTSLTFNKENVKAKEKEYKKLANTVSTEIDKLKLETIIEIETSLELTDTIEDVIAKLKD